MAKQKKGEDEREGETGEETGRTQIKERPSGGNNLVKYYGKNSENKEMEEGKRERRQLTLTLEKLGSR